MRARQKGEKKKTSIFLPSPQSTPYTHGATRQGTLALAVMSLTIAPQQLTDSLHMQIREQTPCWLSGDLAARPNTVVTLKRRPHTS